MANKWNLDGISADISNNLTVTGDIAIAGSTAASGGLIVPTCTVATIPAKVAGGIIYVSDGAAGSPILAFSDGTDWLRSDTGAAVASS